MEMKKNKLFLLYFISFLILEILFKVFTFDNIFNISLLYILIYCLFASLICTFITNLFKGKHSLVVYPLIMLIICLWFVLEYCVHAFFSFFFSFSLLGAATQTLDFASDAFHLIFGEILIIIAFLIPFIISLFLKRKIINEDYPFKKNLKYLILSILVYGIFLGSLFINKNEDYSAYKLYFKLNDVALNIEKMGVLNSLGQDVYKSITNFEEELVIIEPEDVPKQVETIYDYNNLDIDFDNLINNETDSTLKSMHEYFKSEEGTLQNKYTGYFEGKNLVLFMAESFNEIAVDEERTPTLYKLVNSGFSFSNFYTPTISSTIGGEFQELTGLYAASGFLSAFKSGTNYYPMGIATKFKEKGYATFAYHDSFYTFQNRNKYLAALGFDNFLGCSNGLEKKMSCQWLESDIEMIETTSSDYLNSETPFMVFYATVSGHGDYSMNNKMAKKYAEEVSDLNCSDKTKAYLAQQIELDRALAKLISILEENGKLDDTVIALVGDHYPYYLSTSEVNEASSYEKDAIVEINHSNFILWNNQMKTIKVDKVGSQIDVLPTIYNVFKIPYDSRLIIGKDILSSEPGLAMFGNRSWVSDYGTYFASGSRFVLKEGREVEDDYVKKTNIMVSNKIKMSSQIMTKNYYKEVFK